MKEILKFFEMDLYSTSYKKPLIKLLGSIAVMALITTIRLSVTIKNPWFSLVITLFILAIMVAAILCAFSSAVECLQVMQNRKVEYARKMAREKADREARIKARKAQRTKTQDNESNDITE